MPKFKVGDRVRVTGPDLLDGYGCASIGAEGIVNSLGYYTSRPRVCFDTGNYDVDQVHGWYWDEDGLELVSVKPQEDQWDTFLRGEKMSSSQGKVIFKYQMPVLEKFTMKLPEGAQIIRVADQGGMFWLWAVVDTNVPDEERHFVAVKCGGNVPDGNLTYIGFCAIFVQQELGLYIFQNKE